MQVGETCHAYSAALRELAIAQVVDITVDLKKMLAPSRLEPINQDMN
jgi:hypothetical protein